VDRGKPSEHEADLVVSMRRVVSLLSREKVFWIGDSELWVGPHGREEGLGVRIESFAEILLKRRGGQDREGIWKKIKWRGKEQVKTEKSWLGKGLEGSELQLERSGIRWVI